MRALDTNVLVRFLTNDDRSAAAKVTAMLEKAHDNGEQFLVVLPVVLELLWVLKAAYQLSREDILAALEQLTLMPVLEFESDNVVTSLVRLGRSTQTDLPDLLIGLCARERGCEATWTLDKKVSRSDLFRVIA